MGDVIEFSGRRVLPASAQPDYRPFHLSDRQEDRLFFVFNDTDRYLILRYFELERIESIPGVESNHAVLLTFMGSVITEVRLDGRRLLDLVKDLRFHLVSVVREAPPNWDYNRDDRVSVTRISVKTIEM